MCLCRKTANRHFLKSMARVGAGYEEFFDPKTKSKWQRKVCALLVEWQDLWWNSAYSTYNNYCYSLLRMILMCMTYAVS